MATLSVTVPDALVPRVIAALRAQFPDLTDPGGVPLTDAQAARACIKHFLRGQVRTHEGNAVRVTQRNQADLAEQTAWADMDALS